MCYLHKVHKINAYLGGGGSYVCLSDCILHSEEIYTKCFEVNLDVSHVSPHFRKAQIKLYHSFPKWISAQKNMMMIIIK
jgi:hypothetical protein